MKKRLLIILLPIIVCLGFFGYKVINCSETTQDALEGIEVVFEGYDGNGTVKIEGTVKNTTGKKYASKLISGFEYKFDKDSFLKNGDKITLIVEYDEEYAQKKKITVKNAKTEFEVKGLEEGYEEYNGCIVPKDTSEEDKQYLCENGLAQKKEEIGTEQPYIEENSDFWGEETTYTGQLTTETKKEDQEFDYFNDAYNYGMQSSQKFKIETIDNGEEMKFKCIFVD